MSAPVDVAGLAAVDVECDADNLSRDGSDEHTAVDLLRACLDSITWP